MAKLFFVIIFFFVGWQFISMNFNNRLFIYTPGLKTHFYKIVRLKSKESFYRSSIFFLSIATKLHHFTGQHYPCLKVPFNAILSLQLFNTLLLLNTGPILNFLTGISRTTQLHIIKPVISPLSAGSRPHRERCWTLTPDLPARAQQRRDGTALKTSLWPPYVFNRVIGRQFSVN